MQNEEEYGSCRTLAVSLGRQERLPHDLAQLNTLVQKVLYPMLGQ
jgi:hypothetical protein